MPERAKEFFRSWLEDIKLLPAIRQTGYQKEMPDEKRLSQMKEYMKRAGCIRITPEQAEQAEKFGLPRITIWKDGTIGFVRPHPDAKNPLILMGKDWVRMLDILAEQRPVYCSRDRLIIAVKTEAKAAIFKAEKERDAEAYASIFDKITCFLKAVDKNDLSHILKGQAGNRELPDFISAEEKEKLAGMYIPERENLIVADRSIRYLEGNAR